MRGVALIVAGGVAALLSASCRQQPAADTSAPAEPAATATAWPANLSPFGDGYPSAGDPCRRLGESALTVNYLDDSAILVGCPGAAGEPAAAAIVAGGGKVVGAAEGFTLISVPHGDANSGMAEAPPAEPAP